LTTIVADRRGMAADRQTTHGDQKFSGTKIFKIKRTIVGMAGDATQCEQFLEYMRGGDKPEILDDIEALILTPKGLYVCLGSLTKMAVDDPFYALGTGSQAALAAMHMGADIQKAVEIACLIDPSSGGGVDYLKL